MQDQAVFDVRPHESIEAPAQRSRRTQPTPLRWALAMSWIIAGCMVAASLAGLVVDSLYKEG